MKTASRPKFVIGNWKMNPTSSQDAKRLVGGIEKKIPRPKCTVVLVPSTLHMADVKSVLKKTYELGAQDVYPSENGPHTGSISSRMLYALGARFSIVGHSERRALGETNDMVYEKVRSLLAVGMSPVVCVGETERDSHGKYYSFVESEVRSALKGVTRTQIANVIIAYEPVWAISKGDGKGATATPEHAHEMKLFIQKVLVELYGRTVALRVPIVYGGSVNEGNAKELMEEGEVDGFLVGGASLKVDAFVSIIKSVEQA